MFTCYSYFFSVGKIRKRWLERTISETGVGALKALKQHIDPQNIFNNGNLIWWDWSYVTNNNHKYHHLYTLRLRQNGRHFADNTFKCIFLNENIRILFEISLKFVPKGSIKNIPALVQIMAWRQPNKKPLSEPMMVRLPTHICITQPQWVKNSTCCIGIDKCKKKIKFLINLCS